MKNYNKNMMIEEEEEQIQHSNGSSNGQINDQNNNGINSDKEYYMMNQPHRLENIQGQNSDLMNNNFQYCSQYDQQTYYQQNAYSHPSPQMNSLDSMMHNEAPFHPRIQQRSIISNRKSNKKGILGIFENGNQSGSDSMNNSKQKFKSFWHIRFSKDYQEIVKQNLNDENCMVSVCEPQFFNSHIKLRVLLFPQLGVFSGATIRIYFIVTKDYPYKPVLAFAEEYIYHPNINNNTKQIYWKILDDREWKPTLTLYFIILQLKFAFLEPDLTFVPNNIENIQCAELFQCNQMEFRRKFEMFYQSNDTSTLEKDLSNKMNLEEILSEGSEKDFSTLNQLEFQFNRNANLGVQNNMIRSASNYNQPSINNEPFRSQNNFEKKMFENQNVFGNHTNYNTNSTINKSNFQMQNNFENITIENYRGDYNFSQPPSHLKHSPKISQFDNQNNRNFFDNENNAFENHLNIAFSNNQMLDYNNHRNLFSNNSNNNNNNNTNYNNNNYNSGNNMNNTIENCSSVKSSISSSASVEQEIQSNQRMDQEIQGSIYSKLQILTNHISPNQKNKFVNNETLLTPTLKKDREQSIRNQFQVEEPFNEDCEEVLLSGDSNNNQSNYLLIQNPFNSLKEQSLLITSLLDTTSCQMHPKKRKYQNTRASEESNTLDFGKQNKLM